MQDATRAFILKLLDTHRIMTVATNRSDGWPQATVVGYVNDELTLYCFIGRLSQKYANIERDARVSIAIASDAAQPLEIAGLSMSARAAPVEDKAEYARVGGLLLQRYPEYARWPMPEPSLAPLVQFTPEVISVLDYSKGFGHSDLVHVNAADLSRRADTGWRRRRRQPNTMYSSNGYRLRAEECVRLANRTKDAQLQSDILKLRQTYLSIASRLEKIATDDGDRTARLTRG